MAPRPPPAAAAMDGIDGIAAAETADGLVSTASLATMNGTLGLGSIDDITTHFGHGHSHGHGADGDTATSTSLMQLDTEDGLQGTDLLSGLTSQPATVATDGANETDSTAPSNVQQQQQQQRQATPMEALDEEFGLGADIAWGF
ncbi:hypothetical protein CAUPRSCDRAFT_12731 [Caulochytrium protostelioides]|nr:hypothetical protein CAUPRSCDRAFT_12731 [Caulochytrium protostelioides]